METAVTKAISRREWLRMATMAGGAAALAAHSGIAFAGTTGRSASPVRFALLGDWGNGDRNTVDIARQMALVHDRSPLDMVVTTGDNIYPDGSATGFRSKFEQPFEPLLTRKVPFYACLGNHDVRSGREAQTTYPLFHMNGRGYYSHTAGGGTIEVFILDSNDLSRAQLDWLEGALAASTAIWKVAVLHHPPFSSGSKHGSDTGARDATHALFVRHGVRAVFSGHDHIYQRVTPQDGVQYFVSGAGGKIRVGDVKRNDSIVAAAYDDDSHFMVLEADATNFAFRAVSVDGRTVDAGSLRAQSGARSANRIVTAAAPLVALA